MSNPNLSDVTKLCKKYPFIALKYVESINRARDTIDKVKLGSAVDLYDIPSELETCQDRLECLVVDRARDNYNEAKNAAVLNSIEGNLEMVIDEMEKLTEKYDCDNKKNVKKDLALHLTEGLGQHSQEVINYSNKSYV